VRQICCNHEPCHRYLVLTHLQTQPKSFVRFARAYMMDNGLEIVPKLLPLSVHNAYQTARWSVGATYTRIKHKGFIKKQLKDLDSEV